MRKIHRIYTEKFNSYEEAKNSISELSRKYSGRISINGISSYISLPFLSKKYRVDYTIIEDHNKDTVKHVKKSVVPNRQCRVDGIDRRPTSGMSVAPTGMYKSDSFKSNIERIVQETLNLVYPHIKNAEALRGFSANLANKFLDIELLNKAIKSGCVSEQILNELKKSMGQFIYKTLSPSCPIQINDEKKVIALVGPTGVGKTTTCVKIGTKFFIQKIPISFITLDIFRAGADQQLASFTEHMGIKCNKVMDANEVESVMKKIGNSKLIIIDTIGTSQKDTEKLSHVKQILDVIKPTDIYLVIPLNYSFEATVDILNKFSIFNFNRVIVTKADESISNSYSLLFSIRTNAPNAPISYITCGQYPQDILEFEPEKYVEPILSHHFNL